MLRPRVGGLVPLPGDLSHGEGEHFGVEADAEVFRRSARAVLCRLIWGFVSFGVSVGRAAVRGTRSGNAPFPLGS